MENREWINDYSSLKQVSRANPFTVPVGYFDGLEDCIVSLKNLDGLKQEGTPDGFSVPEGYFEGLSGNIITRISVDNYLNINEAGFAVPADYFGNMEQQLLARIFIEETAGNGQGQFAVPDGYFSGLNNNILNKTINASPVKTKGIVRKLFSSAAFKYATAACFAVAIGCGILLNGLKDPQNVHNNSFLHKQLSTVSVGEIENYLQFNVDAGETQHMILTEGTSVNDDKLKDALQDYADSVQ